MKERPILFNIEMVKAVLDGRKTQTRRVIKPQPDTSLWKPSAFEKEHEWRRMPWLGPGHHIDDNMWGLFNKDDKGGAVPYTGNKCPYGQVGDRLWVRETFYIDNIYYIDVPLSGKPMPEDDCIYYRAEGECCDQISECCCSEVGKVKWRPSIFMPRWASRITLEITDIRIERVQDITEEDAKDEGMTKDDDPYWRPSYSDPDSGGYPSYKNSFDFVWDSIYKNWSDDPWVWVVEFKVI